MTIISRYTLVLCLLLPGFNSTHAEQQQKLVLSMPEGSFIQLLSAQIITEAYQRLGYQVTLKKLPNARALAHSSTGVVDGEVSRIAGIEFNYPALIQIPVPINSLEGMAFTLKTDVSITSWEDLRNYELICVRGVKFVERNLQQRNLECHYVGTISQALKMLELKRGDITILPRLNGLKYLQDHGQSAIKSAGPSLVKMELFHYLHKDNQHLVQAVTNELAKMHEEGLINQHRERFMRQHFTNQAVTPN